ncbi:MAG: MMPL family transporter [Desulfotalea sp.]
MFAICSIIFMGLGVKQLRFANDLNQFIPEDGLNLKDDFNLIQQLPAQKQILISLYKENENVKTALLVEAAKDLNSKLTPPYFSEILSEQIQAKVFNPISLRDLIPSLFSDQLATQIIASTTTKEVAKKLAEEQQELFGVGSFGKSITIREDPLELYRNVLPRLTNINALGNIRIRQGLFMNSQEDSVLIIAKTAVATTNSSETEALVKHLDKAFSELPEGIKADALASQIYAAANSSTIKNDIFTVSIIGIVGLIIIAFFFLRTINILPILLAPLIAYIAGAAAIGFVWQPTLAMIFGFAPILLGISIDYALHLYYVYSSDFLDKKETIRQVSKPILTSAFSTVLAFSLLLFSSVSGLRQLSFFIVIGLLATLCYTLFFLPHLLVKTAKRKKKNDLNKSYISVVQVITGKYRLFFRVVFAVVIVFSIFMASKITFQNHIRDLGIRPANLLSAEQRINDTWGKKSDSVMIFSFGNTMDEALYNSLKSQNYMAENGFTPKLSILGILPPVISQQKNQKAWKNFLQTEGRSLQKELQVSGGNLGFSDNAFDPFYYFLQDSPKDITYENLKELGLDSLISQLYFINEDGEHIVISMYPKEVNDIIPLLNEEILGFGSKIISMDEMGKNLGSGLSHSFANFILLALLAMAILIMLMLRSFTATVSALLPALAGLICMAATLSFMQINLGIFALAGALLVIGHGVDYGIYINHYQANKNAGTPTAIIVSGLTSLIGFGALLTAKHPALYDMGISVFSGVFAAMITALFVIPLISVRR